VIVDAREARAKHVVAVDPATAATIPYVFRADADDSTLLVYRQISATGGVRRMEVRFGSLAQYLHRRDFDLVDKDTGEVLAEARVPPWDPGTSRP
jgi:hypothetical protein